jgi:hypothetical protein
MCLFIGYLIPTGPLKAQTQPDFGLLDSFFSNIRWVADASTRVVQNDSDTAYLQMLGFDIHTVIGNQYRDFGTLVLQSYLVRIDNLSPHPGIFSAEDDWAFTYRNFNFNYTDTCRNCPNVRIGHFLLPYGLEHSQDTMGQLLDYNNGRNLGHKADWGLSINKQHRRFEYELGYSLGSGQKIKTNSNQHMITGRIGTLRNANQVYGLSFVHARLAQNKRKKIALDVQYYLQFWGVFAEFGWGKHQSNHSTDSLIELNWRNNNENLLLYTQITYNTVATQADRSNWAGGLRFEPDSKLSVEIKLTRPLQDISNGHKPWSYTAQLRYRY